ncbi:MAG: hypothetical protein K940chlam8_01074 [Chlamydiae bacterium]|nr:hypothetical protein [Chlamydiota bacterium]
MTVIDAPIISDLEATFLENASVEVSMSQAQYMKNLFPFFGIQKPKRAELQRSIFKSYPIQNEDELLAIIDYLWTKAEREYHYAACDLGEKYLKLCSQKALKTFEAMIRVKSWWDTVDKIASNLFGLVLLKYPQSLDHWIQDPCLWIRRTILIYQLRYKEKTNKEKLFEYCEKLMHEKEFFIQKAIGWALREYSKTNPQDVKAFIMKNKPKLSSLSFKEGIRLIK